MSSSIDWKALRDKAVDVSKHAYAPYSRFPVGAAALVDDGRVVAGCNVENVSYGLGLCAECALVCALHSGGGGRLVALVCVDGAGRTLMPCGRCRQVLMEHGGPEMLIDHPHGPRPLGDLLPDAFGPEDLPRGPSRSDRGRDLPRVSSRSDRGRDLPRGSSRSDRGRDTERL